MGCPLPAPLTAAKVLLKLEYLQLAAQAERRSQRE